MNATFNAKAHSYARFAVVQRDLAAWLAEWLEPMEATGRLAALEFGAGDGLFTRRLAGRFETLTAVDVAPQMVARGARALPYVQWRVADAWSFAPLDGMVVDRLYSASLLQWGRNPEVVLRHWRTLVARGGRMLHGFYVAPTLMEWQSVARERSPIGWRHPAQWLTSFDDAGWRVLRSESETRVHHFASALALLRFFHNTGTAAPQHTPVGEMRAMLADYDRRYAGGDQADGVATSWTYFRIETVND
jgi:SAM-dependent methyltransferase